MAPTPAEQDAVWRIAVTSSRAHDPRSFEVLSDEERTRADRYLHIADRERFIVSHAAKRHILAAHLQTEPKSLAFETASGGKPKLVGPWQDRLHFNLSHSGRSALIAIARVEIGVDVEIIRPLPDWSRIARSHFSQREVSQLESLPEPMRMAAFFGCWTRKEAFVKALGFGLTMRLDRFSVTVPPVAAALVEIDGSAETAQGWHLYGLAPFPGHVGCAARQRPKTELLLRTLPENWSSEPD